ncbi:membrane associated rhomboid family serine protease [Chitinophaga terrae (ex Kim and Jung 2007)]|uniref:rhomboid family intramembrane serine protease n=1 Tax=Chitinophaga terrae (ex Kim and Jung 2007) TaxID=408074 RepID=UPI00278A85A5|nr:rhomboid family intramembrane serine protease [Chitinophaga terrae (ex Kim and Jung 2007)]MDQ0108336.1 membrane associated rhomboid family serine protease [Chitinophaga terrae (ex Kim and Jung 2007)]
MNGTSFQSDIRYWLRKGNTVNHLLFWNILIFLVVNILRLIAFVTHQVTPFSWVVDELSLRVPFNTFILQPWGLLTYMFTHVDIFHVLFNMINLYWFGNLFRDFLGDKRVLPLYLLGGFAGGILYLASASLFASPYLGLSLIGASASVMCILVACATLMPNYEIGLMFFGNVKLKWLAIALIALGLISIPNGNIGGIISHMGGSLFGFIYIRLLQAGNDMCKPLIWLFGSKGRMEERRTANRKFKPKKSPLKVVKKTEDSNPSRLDQLLDKINEKGYNSLSAEEKAWLEKVSKEN